MKRTLGWGSMSDFSVGFKFIGKPKLFCFVVYLLSFFLFFFLLVIEISENVEIDDKKTRNVILKNKKELCKLIITIQQLSICR